ncbi:hypothetical protein JJQ51_00850 [Rhizobium sp. AG207R]|nr:hypothetical protein [Rhizobium sp. AG207R]
MSAVEFLATRGEPRQAKRILEAEANKAHDRLPADLIAFWAKHGVGHYADRNYWLCMPFMFDDFLAVILAEAPNLQSKDFAAFGYSSLGTIDLWNRNGRHFTLLAGCWAVDGFDQSQGNRSAAT